MQILNSIQSPFAIHQVPEGVLIRLAVNGESCLGIRLFDVNGSNACVCLLDYPGTNAPTHVRVSLNNLCASYGDAWVLVPKPDKVTRPEGGYRNDPGVLHIQNSEIILVMAPRNEQGENISYNLSTLEREEVERISAPVLTWEIWESEEAYRRGGDDYLHRFEFDETA